jgi:hypothetical protein
VFITLKGPAAHGSIINLRIAAVNGLLRVRWTLSTSQRVKVPMTHYFQLSLPSMASPTAKTSCGHATAANMAKNVNSKTFFF